MVLISIWKNFILNLDKENNDMDYQMYALQLFREEAIKHDEELRDYERKIINRFHPQFPLFDLIGLIVKEGIRFNNNDIDDFDDDFIDFIFDYDNINDDRERNSYDYYGHRSEEISKVKAKRLLYTLKKHNLYERSYSSSRRDEGNLGERMEKLQKDNSTYSFLLDLSPYQDERNLILHTAIENKSDVYSTEAILSKLINIDPKYYNEIFRIFSVEEIVNENFSQKNLEFLEFVLFDLESYNKIKDCTDFTLADLKKHILNVPQRGMYWHGNETEVTRFKRILETEFKGKNVKNYCNYIDIINNHEFVLRISHRDDLLLVVLALKMLVGDQLSEIREDALDDSFTELCILFGKKVNNFRIHDPTYINSSITDVDHPFQRIALALLLSKYLQNQGHLGQQRTKICILDAIKNHDVLSGLNIQTIFDDIKKNRLHIGQFGFPDDNENRNIATDNSIYKYGVNIHDEERDKRTFEAIKGYIDTCTLSRQELLALFDEFWKFKNILPKDKLEDLLRVLGVDGNLVPKIYSGSDFGGLLNGRVHMTFRGVNYGDYDPKILLGYFWNFANTYVDPRANGDERLISNEQETIRRSILNGIIISLQHDGDDYKTDTKDKYHVVCNPGKLQRLVAATLSGRFELNGKYVDIDSNHLVNEIVEGQYIKNINEVYGHLKNFFDSLFINPPDNAEDMFINLFVYVQDLYENNILLDPIYVIYVVILISNSMDGIIIDPTFSVLTGYESIINFRELAKTNFVIDDIKEFENMHPEILENRRLRQEALAMNMDFKFIDIIYE